MSHFVVYVFTNKNSKSIEDIMEPFYEGLPTAPYIKYTRKQAIDKARKDLDDYKSSPTYLEYLANPDAYLEKHANNPGHCEYIKNFEDYYNNITEDELYESIATYYRANKDDPETEDMIDDKGNLLSTYNPNAKWDWWTEDGRWPEALGLPPKSKHEYPIKLSELDFDKIETPFAFIDTHGIWHETGKMGWWGMVIDSKETDDWNKEFRDYLNSVNPETTFITNIDCHI